MRIVRSSPDELVVRSASWLLAGALLAFAAALAPLLFGAGGAPGPLGLALMTAMIAAMAAGGIAAARATTVTLTKSTGRIKFHTVGLIGAGLREHALDDLIDVREDIHADADGKSSRLVFVFSDAAAGEIAPKDRMRIELLRRLGLRRAPPTHIPLTFYYCSGCGAERMAAEINAWRGESYR